MHKNTLRDFVAVATLALVGWFAADAVHAAMADKGSLGGTVMTHDGKPAVGLTLKLEQTKPMGIRGGKGSGKGKSGFGNGSGANGLQGDDGSGGNVKIVARATTDQNGKFTMPNLEVGAYTLVAGNKNMGWIYYPVTIEKDKETRIDDLKLTKTD